MRPCNSLLFCNIGERVLRLSSDKLYEFLEDAMHYGRTYMTEFTCTVIAYMGSPRGQHADKRPAPLDHTP